MIAAKQRQAQYTTLIVNDMEESVSFYRDILHFPVVSEHPLGNGVCITILDGGQSLIELIQNPKFQTGLYSMGIDVPDLDSTLAELKAKGVNITMEPVPTTVGRMAFAKDPNGVNLALIEHHQH